MMSGTAYGGVAVLFKCANPDCAEKFLYLHQGKVFHLMPTPEVQAVDGGEPCLQERFWLCGQCAKKMTLIWNGNGVKLVHISPQPITRSLRVADDMASTPLRSRAAAAARDE
jgi:hypothetical protein